MIPAPVTGTEFPGAALVAALSSEGRLLLFRPPICQNCPVARAIRSLASRPASSSRRGEAGAVAVLEPASRYCCSATSAP